MNIRYKKERNDTLLLYIILKYIFNLLKINPVLVQENFQVYIANKDK